MVTVQLTLQACPGATGGRTCKVGQTVELEPKRGCYREAAPSGDGRTFSSLPPQQVCE